MIIGDDKDYRGNGDITGKDTGKDKSKDTRAANRPYSITKKVKHIIRRSRVRH